jgi:hypothetical protein
MVARKNFRGNVNLNRISALRIALTHGTRASLIHAERILKTYRLCFLKAGKPVSQREFYATDPSVACMIASAACRTSEIAHDTTELWEGTQQIDWSPRATNASLLAEERQGNIIDREIALTNSAWALNAARTLIEEGGKPKKRES